MEITLNVGKDLQRTLMDANRLKAFAICRYIKAELEVRRSDGLSLRKAFLF